MPVSSPPLLSGGGEIKGRGYIFEPRETGFFTPLLDTAWKDRLRVPLDELGVLSLFLNRLGTLSGVEASKYEYRFAEYEYDKGQE